jgi:Skp family chaperone for outer membrane proteins
MRVCVCACKFAYASCIEKSEGWRRDSAALRAEKAAADREAAAARRDTAAAMHELHDSHRLQARAAQDLDASTRAIEKEEARA